MKTLLSLCLLLLVSGISFAQVADRAENVKPIKVGETIADITVRLSDGSEVTTTSLFEEQKSVLVFYRGGWCPYCNKHLAALKSVENDLVELGYRILAVSPDRPEKLQTSTAKHDLKYVLLSDSKMELTKSAGLAFQLADAEVAKLKGYGMDLEESSGENHHLLPVPAIFVVNEKGQVLYRYYNADYKTRLDNKELLKAAKEIAS